MFSEKKLLEVNKINKRQNQYVEELVQKIRSNKKTKELYFTSPTGTGKTHMMAKLIDSLPENFFIVTTLSRGGLHLQIKDKLKVLCEKNNNFKVFGLSDYTKNTNKKKKNEINELINKNKDKIIWIRDEAHVKTNNWHKIFEPFKPKIINFSATNFISGIKCKFNDTYMLRKTKIIPAATIKDVLDKLSEIKKIHENVPKYNPCAIFRVFNEKIVKEIEKESLNRKFNVKNLSHIKNHPREINNICCCDENETDVVITKLKITEGIDFRRCHCVYLDNFPKKTTIKQFIGRASRNALFWREDIDIFAEKNSDLKGNNELMSIENLCPNESFYVKNGFLNNGIKLIELREETGEFQICYDEKYQANYINIKNYSFYKEVIEKYPKTGPLLEIHEYIHYSKKINDREIAILGPDTIQEVMHKDKKGKIIRGEIIEDKKLTSKMRQHCKFKKFIEKKYGSILKKKLKIFFRISKNKKNNNYGFDKRFNSSFGYCVEYYAKIELELIDYRRFKEDAKKDLISYYNKNKHKCDNENDILKVRIAALFYKEEMEKYYSNFIGKKIKPPSIYSLIKDNFAFVEKVIKFGNIAKEFICEKVYGGKIDKNHLYDPLLSVNHISALCDFISKDTILDLKCHSANKECLLQILAYHYLSTKRDDLKIKKLILYDPTIDSIKSENFIEIDLTKYKNVLNF